MKVILINAVCGSGSTGRICQDISEELIRQGHSCLVLYGNGYSDYAHARRVCSHAAVRINGVLARLTGITAGYAVQGTNHIIRVLEQEKPDIVHLHNLHGNYVNIKRLYRYLAEHRIPVVITLHDCWFFTGKCTHYTDNHCYRWKEGCGHCPKLRADIPSLFFDRTAKMWNEKRNGWKALSSAAVIGVSDWITDEAKQSFLPDNATLQRIYNWIDTETFKPVPANLKQKYHISSESKIIACVGAKWPIGSQKRNDLVTLATQMPTARFIVVGEYEKAENEPDNIISVGYLSRTQTLAEIYSGCDAYVHLSHEDTFGKVIAEAMACGTPAVVYQQTACPELIANGKMGEAVACGDLEACKNALMRLWQQSREEVKQACVSYVTQTFNKQRLLQDTIELYSRLTNQ